MPFFIISILFQVAFVLHVLKTGRNTTWIWIIVMLPMAGSIAYLIMEVMPDILGSKKGRKATAAISKSLNPEKSLNEAREQFSISPTNENAIRLADELILKNRFEEAITLYEHCLNGIHTDDPGLLFKLAKAEFGINKPAKSKQLLDQLIESHPDYKNADAHLLYARSLDALNNDTAALHEYEVLHRYYPGAEAAFHYAMLCKKMGNMDLCKELLEEIALKAKRSGQHYNEIHKPWIQKAKAEMAKA